MIINGREVRVFDNGGKTLDRYTVIIDGSIFAMSGNPEHPQGVNQYVGEKPCNLSGDRELRWDEVPEPVRKAILNRIGHIR